MLPPPCYHHHATTTMLPPPCFKLTPCPPVFSSDVSLSISFHSNWLLCPLLDFHSNRLLAPLFFPPMCPFPFLFSTTLLKADTLPPCFIPPLFRFWSVAPYLAFLHHAICTQGLRLTALACLHTQWYTIGGKVPLADSPFSACLHASAQKKIHKHSHSHKFACTRTHTHAHTQTHTHTHKHTHTCVLRAATTSRHALLSPTHARTHIHAYTPACCVPLLPHAVPCSFTHTCAHTHAYTPACCVPPLPHAVPCSPASGAPACCATAAAAVGRAL